MSRKGATKMSDKQKTTQKESRTPFEGLPFGAMMAKMMGRQGQSCGCMEMMSQMMEQQDMDCDCAEMMTMCGRAQDNKETTAEASQKA
jgi:hypothetical protein